MYKLREENLEYRRRIGELKGQFREMREANEKMRETFSGSINQNKNQVVKTSVFPQIPTEKVRNFKLINRWERKKWKMSIM